ncbi:MAG: alginate export family protein [Phycisphaerae bacterium]|nr:alginate export family protein [Phycisphaerae bacterium]
MAGGLVVLLASAARAQRGDVGGLNVFDEQLRVYLDKQKVRETGVDAGGWFNFAYMHYDDAGAQRTRNLRRYELRGWGSANLQEGAHKFYVRGLLNYDDWDTGNNPIGQRGDDFDEEVERAWYQFDLGKLLLHQTGQRSPYSLDVKAGRDFTTIGTALVLSAPLDQVQFHTRLKQLEFTALLGQTVHDTHNIDYSQRVANHMDRTFYGFELAYNFSRHRPFVYYLGQSDHTHSVHIDPLQKYDYSSRYLGAGSTGSLISPNLSYQTEAVGEWGRTYSEGVRFGQDEICAFAADALLEYHFRVRTNPRVMAEYIIATGDPDRRLSTNSTVGGNLAGTKDKAFNAFGFRDTGIAFAPRISNLQMYVLGARFFPLESMRLFQKMEVGTKVFFYQKQRPGGPVSDTLATDSSSWLGWEWDVYANWRITSDLAWTIRYGVFEPGAAYDTFGQGARDFFYTGAILSF